MSGSKHAIAASCAVAAALCLSLWLVSKNRSNRHCGRRASRGATASKHIDDLNCRASDTQDRCRPEEEEQVFALYAAGESESEPSCPPMELSEAVCALLESFDVDPVRGKLNHPADSYMYMIPFRKQ